MAKIALYFDIPDNEVGRLIPSVSLDVEIYANSMICVTDKKESDGYHLGTNAVLVVLPND